MNPTPKTFPLSGLYHLTIGELYEQQCLRDIKQELEAIHGVKIQRATTQSELIYVCKNGLIHPQPNQPKPENSEDKSENILSDNLENLKNVTVEQQKLAVNLNPQRCSYFVLFSIKFRIQKPVYKLENFHLNHSSTCKDEEQACFLRNRRQISIHSGAIMKIVAYKRAKLQQCNSPTSILNILCEQTGLDPNFIFRGIKQNSYKRKLKKKFDNVIAEAKRAEINPRHYLSAELYQLYYKNGKNQSKTQNNAEGSCGSLTEQKGIDLRKMKGKKINKREKKRDDNRKITFECEQNKSSVKLNNQSSANIGVASCVSLYESSEVDPAEIDPTLYELISDHTQRLQFFEDLHFHQNMSFRDDVTPDAFQFTSVDCLKNKKIEASLKRGEVMRKRNKKQLQVL